MKVKLKDLYPYYFNSPNWAVDKFAEWLEKQGVTHIDNYADEAEILEEDYIILKLRFRDYGD